VAHELNEPLGSILGFAQLMHRAPRLPEETRRDLAKIIDAAMHAREIVKKLMLFARQTPPQKGPLNLNKLVDDGLIFLESRCAQEGIQVRRVLAPRLPEITADASQLQQVLVNLVVNAIQAMQGGGTLTIRTAAADRHVSLVVEDTGVGMSEDVRRRAFLPFFTTKPVGKGTGLGLSVVHGIVQAHGGAVRVDSRQRAGTRFTVELPRRHVARGGRRPTKGAS
jgi:signal transduction histidine kinase